MRLLSAMRVLLVLVVMSPSALFAQSSAGGSSATVPRLINISGVFRPADGQPAGAVETVTLSIYADQEAGAPLWQETQTIALDGQGRYSLLLGSSQPDGIPAAVFASGEARWRGALFERAGEVEGARVRITSVPYALRASDADTLGGRPASDYLLTTADKSQASAAKSDVSAPAAEQPGTPNYLAKYVSTTDVGQSALYETGGNVGLGTTVPFDFLHIAYNNTDGSRTGIAVQNMGSSPTSYSGMLFFDQNNQLGQFQGFNNFTHEYRINNIARNGGGAFNGSINFMTGSTSRFVVASTGNIGIGTTAPSALLEVSNAVPGGPANMWITSYTNFVGPYYMARRARGTPGAPTAAQSGDGLSGLYGQGYGTTAFGPAFTGGMTVQAAQNFTDTAQGTALTFMTTPISSITPATRMTLDASGNLGIGTSFPTALLEISNGLTPASPASATFATYTAAPGGSFLTGRKARGTLAAPTAVQNGDGLLSLSGRGYGTTAFGVGGGATIGMSATESYTDTAMGGQILFFTTPNGTTTLMPRMAIANNGDVGIGTQAPSIPGLEVTRTGTDVGVGSTVYTNGADVGSFLVVRTARGTAAAPLAVQTGDFLGAVLISGYATTRFQEAATVAAVAAENFTDTARGTALGLATTPLGGNDSVLGLTLLPSGNVGIGTPADANGIPTATDKLQVFGDVRLGNAGTNGCLKNFAGTVLAGTCASDRRFKRNITPFGPVLNRFAALQPVRYYWRATEFPDQHFGDAQAYGLIAQDVEQVLPDLVVTRPDGYKAVDYSELPLLTIQAVKDLKSENDALKQRVADLEKSDPDALKRRVAELERLVSDLLATSARR